MIQHFHPPFHLINKHSSADSYMRGNVFPYLCRKLNSSNSILPSRANTINQIFSRSQPSSGSRRAADNFFGNKSRQPRRAGPNCLRGAMVSSLVTLLARSGSSAGEQHTLCTTAVLLSGLFNVLVLGSTFRNCSPPAIFISLKIELFMALPGKHN